MDATILAGVVVGGSPAGDDGRCLLHIAILSTLAKDRPNSESAIGTSLYVPAAAWDGRLRPYGGSRPAEVGGPDFSGDRDQVKGDTEIIYQRQHLAGLKL